MRLHDTPLPRMPLPASSIDLDGCKRRFLYQYVYQLYDDLSPFLRMHQAIRECVKTLTGQARNGVLPVDEAELRTLVFGQLQRYELDAVLYAGDYAAETLRHVQSVWDDLRNGRIAPERVDRRVIVRRPAGEIEVRIDREEVQNGTTRWVWVRSGAPRSDDHLAERVMLYALARRETPHPLMKLLLPTPEPAMCDPPRHVSGCWRTIPKRSTACWKLCVRAAGNRRSVRSAIRARST